MRSVRQLACVATLGASVCVPMSSWAQNTSVADRLEKLEDRMRDAEARLAKVEAMVNSHSVHGSPVPQAGSQGMPQGGKGMGGMMDDDGMMGMGGPTTPNPAQPSQPGAAPMGGGGMGGHM